MTSLPRTGVAALIGIALVSTLPACSTTVMDLKTGDCLNLPSDLDLKKGAEFSLSAVQKVECQKPHQAEVIHAFSLADSDKAQFPGMEKLWEQAQQTCTKEFEKYVGTTLENSSLELMPMLPSEESWKDSGDHTALCVAYLSEGKVSRSFKNFK